jgi:hypothetical protein
MKADIRGYDVWGNSKDGYEVNDSYVTVRGITVLPGEYDSDKGNLKLLKRSGFLKKQARLSQLDFDSPSEENVYINVKKTGYPLGEIYFY